MFTTVYVIAIVHFPSEPMIAIGAIPPDSQLLAKAKPYAKTTGEGPPATVIVDGGHPPCPNGEVRSGGCVIRCGGDEVLPDSGPQRPLIKEELRVL